jgi:SAM-dependent methyltransferase
MTGAERHYVGEAGKTYHAKKHVLPKEAVSWVARLRAQKIQSFVQPSDIVLEYGAGYGWNLIELRCARRIAFEISENTGVEGEGIEWLRSLENFPLGSVNVIICHHTLEHVDDPKESLLQMRELLCPGGRLLLYVPYEKERRYNHYNPNEPNHHLNSWNAQTLGNQVSERGLKVESAGIGEFGYDRFAANLCSKLKLGEAGFRLIRRMAHVLKPASEVRVVARRV